jgi:hypothetical protein
VKRFVRRLAQRTEPPFRRLECAAGQELQVDFGQGAWVLEQGRRRRPHLFRAVLSHSRKGYSEVVWRQTGESFIRCLENAFRHFGGVSATVVIDNLKAGVIQADWFDPQLNPKIEEFARHYGTPRRAQLAVQQLPRVISPDDETVLPNTLAVTLTGRARRASSALERAAVHLNLAVAWLRLQSWTDATAALDTVDAVAADASLGPDARAAIAGTSAYLRGVVLARTGDAPGAARAFALAAQSTGPMLIDGAGSLKELVERRR